MQIRAIDGSMHEISMEEAKRIYHEVAKHMGGVAAHHARETPEQYHNRAFNNICKRAEAHGISGVRDEEDDIKELFLIGIDLEDADMVGEIIEWFVHNYAVKVGA